MNRTGWIILSLFLLAGVLFTGLLTFGESGPVPASPTPAPSSFVPVAGALLVPVAGVARADLADSWGDTRGGGLRSHQGLDIMAPRGTTVVAAAAGRVEKLFVSEAGGNTVYIRTPGAVHYYAHLDGYAPGLIEGQPVRAGEAIGYVGDSGNAGAGNFHLHFAINRMRAGDSWYGGEPVNPYPLLVREQPRG